ncbi:hypothetical protein [uncultured Nitrosomonas sp.]|uniref:hypothetical protein n=1 Tax=uncultured Nitrosomonas sp. TaxID=156424 RepID=UPI0025E79AA2|nr:hypothetical protein [uncultured Nitrosomonas sp.]
MNKPSSVTMQQAIQEANKEVEHFVSAETDSMLRDSLVRGIDLSIRNIGDSIENGSIEGSVIKENDGSPDPLQSTITKDGMTRLIESVRRSLEKTKAVYVYQRAPENTSAIHAGYIFVTFSIRKEWDLWARKQQLLANEAISLMNGSDPKSWEEYRDGAKNLPDEMVSSINRSLNLADNEGFNNKTPKEWLTWGRNHDLDKPMLKSKDWLEAPDVCMFYLFETAVMEILEPSGHTDSIKKTIKSENGKSEIETENTKPNTELIPDEPLKPEIYDLFDAMNKAGITALFEKVTQDKWKIHFERAARNGLKCARQGDVRPFQYNPAKVADWLVTEGLCTREYADRKLKNNLPNRSKDMKHVITGYFD